MRVRALAISALLLAAGCSSEPDDAAAPVAEPSVSETSPASSIETLDAPPAQDVDGEIVALCDAYLEHLHGDNDPLREVLGPDAPAGVVFALETLDSPSAGLEEIWESLDNVRGYVLPACRETFTQDVVPQETDEAAAEEFRAALLDWDRERAARVAPAHDLVLFDPWQPLDPADYGDVEFEPAITIGRDDFDGVTVSGALAPAYSFGCSVEQGIVTNCALGE